MEKGMGGIVYSLRQPRSQRRRYSLK